MILRLSFTILLLCHVPFIFFAGKESLLIIVDEITRRQISLNLDFSINGIDNTNGNLEDIRDVMSFKSMKKWVYLTGTLLLYTTCVLGGLFVKDLGVVFEIIAALTKTNINFICPGYFYLLACRRFYSEKEESSRLKYKIISVGLISFGLVIFLIVASTNFGSYF